MRILVTGSTGLVGTALVRVLARDGNTVCRLVRPESMAKAEAKSVLDVPWNPATGELSEAALAGTRGKTESANAQEKAEGADAVVNLAGASIAGGRWTKKRKKLLRSSRVDTTRALVNALAKMNPRPSVLVSASATGYYGNRGDEILTEESAAGEDFLAGLAKEWEAEAQRAEALGIRVVLARFGIVLAREGGALPQMMLPFYVYAGGKMGSGKQWMSWVALEDVVEILRFVLTNEAARGAINVVAPEPLRNAEFTRVLAGAMHRFAILPAPAFALRLALGEMADALLGSQRAVPQRLRQLGYSFRHAEPTSALAAILLKG
jgi:uncharacterized protein